MTVANAASAQTAYEVTVAFGLPRGLVVTGVQMTGGASGWHCDRPALTCTGTVPAGASGRIGLSGRLPAAAPGASYTVSARVAVRDTSQLHGTVPTAFGQGLVRRGRARASTGGGVGR